MERKFLVISCKNQNKKIGVENFDVNDIRKIVKDRFFIENPHITYFDNDVDDWVDLDPESNEYLRDLKVLKVKVHVVDEAPTVIEPKQDSCSSNENENNIPPLPPLPSLPSTSQQQEQNVIKEKTPTPSVPKEMQKNKSWSKIYRVPKGNFARGVVDKLGAEEELSSSERKNMLEAIYNDVTKFDGGMYPTSDMYDDIVDGLLREYPYLLTVGGLPANSARTFWKDRIIYKFGNARKTVDKSHQEVVQKKRKKEQKMEAMKDLKQFTWGLGNFLPKQSPSEDETSIKLHVSWLKRENKKSIDIDHQNVKVKMDITFPYRRSLIVNDKLAVSEVVDAFPWLGSYREILDEFKRLCPNTVTDDIEELMGESLRKYRKAVLKVNTGKKKPTFLKEIEHTSAQYRTESQRNYADDCIAIIGLFLLCKENPEKILLFSRGPTACTPMAIGIKINQNILSMDNEAFEILLENESVFKCENFFQAFCGLIATIYVFNIAYPKPVEKTFMFFQQVMIGLKDEGGHHNIDKRILGVLTNINRELKNI
ncbi:sterile alpha motif domain-containing protein 3-like isoform X2 [Saccostrea echinata]|uniref:sterile alpha motif domain-containing protein 3-like isoform X2 n=1 Tax=Saccostrea echinata TaxID=191078 RepID=UPI002A829D33|nr:sterile alpha motif domain-containing protein 3-like isoform X2 [Saccostrea echinata]